MKTLHLSIMLAALAAAPLSYAADNASDSNKARSSNPAQIDTAHGAAMKSCDTLPAGRDKNVCNAEKDAQANIAKAEQGVNTRNDEASRQELRRVRADSEFNIAKAKCDNEPGCLKNAQSNYDKAQAQIKSGVAPTVVQ